jgi:tripartite-type tricarboxylate transporter receptor subunit TctC
MTTWLYSVAPRDGTALGLPPPQVALHQVMGMSDVKFDARRFAWIFRAAPVVELTYTWFASPTKSVADARRRVTVMGAVSPSSGGAVYLNELNSVAGTRFKIVTGYPGMTEINLAIERGEVEGTTKPWASLKVENADWLRDHKLNFLLQYGRERSPELPDVPTLSELAKTDLDREAFRLQASVPTIGRGFAAPPGVPAERIAALRAAFHDTARDADFLAEAKAQRIDLGPLDGPALQALVNETFGYSAEAIRRVKQTGAR